MSEYRRLKLHIKINLYGMYINITFVICSILSSLSILLTPNIPVNYSLLFCLPLGFGILSLCFYEVYDMMPYNLGITLIISLLLIRNVIAPVLLVKGNFSSTINMEENVDGINYSIVLLIYEMICIFFTILYLERKSSTIVASNNRENDLLLDYKTEKKYIVTIFIALAVLILCYYFAPQFMLNYRTVFEMTQEHAVNYEDYMINRKYGTTTIKLLALVMGNYIMRIVMLVVPAVTIIVLANKKKSNMLFVKVFTFIICFIPMLFIGGAIARSLIYCICLFMLRDRIFYSNKSTKRTIMLLILGVIVIFAWWIFRDSSSGSMNNNIWVRYSERINAYFSGVNVVSGVFNLPKSLDYRLKYCIGDILSSFPFGNTIFSLDGITSSEFFNNYNFSFGQIPPTIGMSYYYFGFLLSPFYSVLFTILSFKYSEKFRIQNIDSAIEYIRSLYSIFVFSMGIVMYNIEITLTNTFCILLPMYIMEIIAINKKEEIKK